MNSRLDLLEVLSQQESIIISQNETIAKLIDEVAEQESIISELMRGNCDA